MIHPGFAQDTVVQHECLLAASHLCIACFDGPAQCCYVEAAPILSLFLFALQSYVVLAWLQREVVGQFVRVALKVFGPNEFIGWVGRQELIGVLSKVHQLLLDTLHVAGIELRTVHVKSHHSLAPGNHSINRRVFRMILVDEVELLDEGEVDGEPHLHLLGLFLLALHLHRDDQRPGIASIHVDVELLEVDQGVYLLLDGAARC